MRKDTRKQYLKRLFVGCRDPRDSGQKQSPLGILQDKKIRNRRRPEARKTSTVTLVPTPARNLGPTNYDVSDVRNDKSSFDRNTGFNNIV